MGIIKMQQVTVAGNNGIQSTGPVVEVGELDDSMVEDIVDVLEEALMGPMTGIMDMAESPSEVSEEDIRRDMEERAASIVRGDYDVASKWQEQIAPLRTEAYKYYRSKSLGNEREGRSQVISSDVLDAIEWVMPSLMRIYFSSDIVTCEPIGKEDVESARKAETLLNYQFVRKSHGFKFTYKWFKDALLYSLGIAKITWEDKYSETEFVYDVLTKEEFDQFMASPIANVDAESITYEEVQRPINDSEVQKAIDELLAQAPPEATDEEKQMVVNQMLANAPMVTEYKNVKGINKTLMYSGPNYEILPPEDFLYDPEAEELEDARFVIHRVYRTIDYLKKKEKEGIYINIDEAVEHGTGTRGMEPGDVEKSDRFFDNDQMAPWDATTGIEESEKRTPVEVLEWWGYFDPNDDGAMESYVITMVNGVVIRLEKNPYHHQEFPFEVLRPILDVHKFEGISLADLVKDFQDTKTSLRRQVLDNISWQNNGMWEVNRSGGVETESLTNPRPGGIVRVDVPGSIRQITPQPLQQQAFMALEFEQSQLEQRTGVTRYNQGLDAKSLNKTATGITAIMGASQQRIELIARLFAETGVQRLFTKALALNKQFLKTEYMVRLYNETLTINKDDLDGQFDILISVGVSAGKQEIAQQQMIQLIQMAPGLAQAGVMTPDNIYQVMKKLFEGWGFKDFDRFITNPSTLQQMQQQMQQMQMEMQKMISVLQHPQIAPMAQQVAQQVEMAVQQTQQEAPAGGGQPPQGPPQGPQQEPPQGPPPGVQL